MDLTFNVVFVPASVRYLRIAVLSLLRYSSHRYRLIANGLGPDEKRLMRQFCTEHDRLEMLDMRNRDLLTHGSILTLLQARECGSHFCFMDSDIFATAPFDRDLQRHLVDCDVFSSCQQMAVDSGEVWVGLDGRCTEAPNGFPLATTFFGVYRRGPLQEAIEDSGVTMMRYEDQRLIPEGVRQELTRLGLDGAEFDTGKLLNVVMHRYNLTFKYTPLEMLQHIGGMSWPLMTRSQPVAAVRDADRSSPLVLRDEDLLTEEDGRAPRLDRRVFEPKRGVKRRKHRIAAFFVAYFEWLFDGRPRPRVESSHPMANRVRHLCRVIEDLYENHRDSLAESA